jgi:flagellar motor component MotA
VVSLQVLWFFRIKPCKTTVLHGSCSKTLRFLNNSNINILEDFMIRYLISLVVFLTGIVWAIITSGGRVLTYLDIPSFIFVGIFPFIFVSVIFGFKEMALSFSVSLKKETEKEKLINALDFFKTYGKITWFSGFIMALVGVIAALVYLEDKTALGINLAVALFSMLYSGIINVIIIPFTVFIKKQLKEQKQ